MLHYWLLIYNNVLGRCVLATNLMIIHTVCRYCDKCGRYIAYTVNNNSN